MQVLAKALWKTKESGFFSNYLTDGKNLLFRDFNPKTGKIPNTGKTKIEPIVLYESEISMNFFKKSTNSA